jgi:hypothetical protein
MNWIFRALVLLSAGAVCGAQQSNGAVNASLYSRCAWMPPTTAATVRVRSAGELYRAVDGVRTNTTILLEPGDYPLERMIDFDTPGVVLRGATPDPSMVVLHGDGMLERRVGVALSVSTSDLVIANLTVRDVGYHGIQVRGERGVSRITIQNVRIADTGQQLIKGSTDGGPLYSSDVTVACSVLGYTDHAPSNYTNGVDVLGGRNWVIRDNRFIRIRGLANERFAAGPAILFWGNSIDTQVERNTVIDSSRGIALGLGPRVADGAAERGYDHQGGWIRNNVVVNLNSWADEGIEANAAVGVSIDHNTVMTSGLLSWSISARFPQTTAQIRNNLTSQPVVQRDGGRASGDGNVSGAAPSWFVNLAVADVRLAGSQVPAVDAGIPIAEVDRDAAGRPRSGAAPDAGAYEYQQ